MRAFEIQTFTGGKWKIDSVFDDRDLAVFEARRMDDSNRYAGVRVVEETFDEETEQSVARTIFRGGRVGVDVSRPSAPPASRRRRAGARTGGGARGEARTARRAAKQTKSNIALVVLLTLIVIGGIAAMAGLHVLPRYL